MERVSWHLPGFESPKNNLFGYIDWGGRKIRIYIFETHMLGVFYVDIDEYTDSSKIGKKLFSVRIDNKCLFECMRIAQDISWEILEGKEISYASTY